MFCPALLPVPSTAWIQLPFPSHHMVSLLIPIIRVQRPFPWQLSEKCSLHPSLPPCPAAQAQPFVWGHSVFPWLVLIGRVTSVRAPGWCCPNTLHPQLSPDRIWQHQDPIFEAEHCPLQCGAFSTGKMWRDGAHREDTQHFISPPASRGVGEGKHQHIC